MINKKRKTMTKVLFFTEPWIEMSKPSFRLGAVRNVFLNLINNFSTDIESCIILGEGLKHYVDIGEIIIPNNLKVFYISNKKLLLLSHSGKMMNDKWYKGEYTKDELSYYCDILKDRLQDFIPDIIIGWETPMPFMKKTFPEAMNVYMMPGMMSRVPYPELTSIDFEGYFKDSTLVKHQNLLRQYIPAEEEIVFLREIRRVYLDEFIAPLNIFKDLLHSEFDYYILLPLQVSNYFAFDSNCSFTNQFELLQYVLEGINPNIGVIVTQYSTPNIQDLAITDENIEYLNSKYPNMIYNEKFNSVDAVSQYILPMVDGVVCVSSSIGMQAALWDIPIFSIGNSHLNVFSENIEVDEIYDYLYNNLYKKSTNDNLLIYILTRMQPLTINYLYHTDWFENMLIRTLNSYRNGDRGLSLYKPIDDVKEYTKIFLMASKKTTAIKKITSGLKEDKLIRKVKAKNNLINKIRNKKYKYISFDIFDTLLVRPFEKPTDVFRMMENNVVFITNEKITLFLDERVKAERNCKDRLLDNSRRQEITLSEIYQEIAQNNELSIMEKEKLEKLEIEYELKYLRRRESIIELFELAKTTGKKVIITSDMYLPQGVIERILNKNDIIGYEKLYLSSSIYLKKHYGDLYEYILKDLKIEASEILHIGDNKHGDIKKANEKRIDTIHTPRALDLFYLNKINKKLFWPTRNIRELSESIFIGLVSNKLYDDQTNVYYGDTHFNNTQYNLGYFGLGYMFVGFVTWIIEEAIADKIEDLYFLARDGDIIYHVYNVIAKKYKNAPRTHYLLASRRSFQVASLISRKELKEFLQTTMHKASILSLLTKKFGIDISEISLTQLQEYGFESLDDVIDTNERRERFKLFILSIEDVIFKSAKVERDALVKYLVKSGFTKRRKQAVVDIGYAGTMQKSISELLELDTIYGYYFLTFKKAKTIHRLGHTVKGYVANFIDQKKSYNPISNLGLAFEIVFSNKNGSFIKMTESPNGILIPIFEATKNEAQKRNFIGNIQSGINNFIRDYVEVTGENIKLLTFDHESGIRIYVDYLRNPAPRDVSMMEGVLFDDEFGGAGKRYMIPPYYGQELDIMYLNTIWKKGCESFYKSAENFNIPIMTAKKKDIESNIHSMIKTYNSKVFSFLLFVGRFFLSEKKYQKLKNNPRVFFLDSKYKTLQKFGKKVLCTN